MLTPFGPLNWPLPAPVAPMLPAAPWYPEPMPARNEPLLLNSSTRLLPLSTTHTLPLELTARPLTLKLANWPLPLPAAPMDFTKLPLELNSCTRVLPLSPTQTLPPLSTPMPLTPVPL